MVLDDEQHLIVVLRVGDRPLRVQQQVQAQVAAVGEAVVQVGADARFERAPVAVLGHARRLPDCAGRHAIATGRVQNRGHGGRDSIQEGELTMSMSVRGLIAGLMVLCGLGAAGDAQAEVVISQVYGAGGNSGAVYDRDYVELFNRGGSPVPLAGKSVQYASATGTGNFGANANQIVALPAVTLEPGQYLLLGLAGGSHGGPLP